MTNRAEMLVATDRRTPVSYALVASAMMAIALMPSRGSAASLQELAQRLFPHATINGVGPTPIPNLRGPAGKSIVYMDVAGRYVLVGELYDFATRKNLTAQKLLAFNAVNFDELPLGYAIHLGPVHATKRVAVFEDVDCPFCRKFHTDTLPALLRDGLGVAVFLLPLPDLHPQAEMKSTHIWCSEDRPAALRAVIEHPASAVGPVPACDTPLAEIAKTAQAWGITGTPTFVFDTGLRVDGFLSYDALMARWESSVRQ
jgi:thiol:disulfide interchange protein DsbC